MNVLHIINGLETGGAEKLLIETIPLLSKNDIKVDVLLLNGKETAFYKKLRNERCCKIFYLGYSYYNPIYIIKIIKYMRNYELIHVHLFPSLYFAAIAKYLSFSKIPLIFTEHSTSNTRLQKRYFKLIEKFIYKRYSKIICITESVMITLEKKLNIKREKLVVIENGIDILNVRNQHAYQKEDFGYSSVDVLLVMVAGFRIEKDQDTIIKVLKLLPENYKLILVGDGDRRDKLVDLIKRLKLEHRVNLLGIRNDVYNIIKMCNIAVISSHWEGFGLVAVESMACKIPTIASNVEGLGNVVKNGGLLFEKGNVEDLKRKIESLNDSVFYNEIAIKGFNKSEFYDINNMINETLSLYKKILLSVKNR